MRIHRVIGSAGAALLSGLLVAGINPAVAKPRPEPAPAAQSTDETKPATTDRRRYCLMAERTGSRILEKVCKTRAEWDAEEGAHINYPKE